jgi:hypothetical protein
MGYFDKLSELGFIVVCRRNQLGTTTMFAVKPEEMQVEAQLGETINDYLSLFTPEWRLVDFRGDDAGAGARMLYEKLTVTGNYVDYDKRIIGSGSVEDAEGFLIGFEHRPEGERYVAVEHTA